MLAGAFLLFLLSSLHFSGVSHFSVNMAVYGEANAREREHNDKYSTLDDLKKKRFAIFTGTVYDGYVTRTFPEAQVLRFETTPDMILALKSGKADVMLIDLVSAEIILKQNPVLGILENDFFDTDAGIGFSKNEPELRARFNEYLDEIRSDGTYDEIFRRWFVENPDMVKMPDIPASTSGPRYIMGVAVDDLPFIAFINGQHVGFDIEIMKRFALDQNIRIDIMTMEFSALVPALASGKVSIITDGIAITEERSKLVDFSNPYVVSKTAAVVLKSKMAAYSGKAPDSDAGPRANVQGFIATTADSFYRNIILEDRWKIILSGLKITVIISIFSTLFGTLFGAAVCTMRMSGCALLNIPAKIYVSVMRGTPVLVLLMLMFYVVFASINIDPVIVAIIAFSLNFAAYVSEIFRAGIQSIDKGQTEAGIAMGFSGFRTFLFIILPQTVRRILPVYKGEFISLVKMTSIVGYIAVQDLAKASDIIRSRTFDAFFPLMMVAVLYFLISLLLLFGIEYLEHKADHSIQKKTCTSLSGRFENVSGHLP